MSGSFSFATFQTGLRYKSGKAKPAPYNFFYGPSYSDALRALLTWAAEDWKAKGGSGKPKFVHMGANHPYPNCTGGSTSKPSSLAIASPASFGEFG